MNYSNTNIETLRISNNGLYLIGNERIYFVKEEQSYPIENISLTRWFDILSENTTFSIKNKMVDVTDLIKYQRKITYQLLESFSTDEKTKLMVEYENKFGKLLLNENALLIEDYLNEAWEWGKRKLDTAVEYKNDLVNCIRGSGNLSGKCSPLFEDFREILLNPVSITIDALLTVTGYGKIPLMVIWGIMGIWDVYLLSSGSPNADWFNLIIDLLGFAGGAFAKSASTVAKTAGLSTKGKTLSNIVKMGTENPKTAGLFMKIYEFLKTIVGKIGGFISEAAKFLYEKFGLKHLNDAAKKFSIFVDKILNTFKINEPNMVKAIKVGTPTYAVAKGIDVATKQKDDFWDDAEFNY